MSFNILTITDMDDSIHLRLIDKIHILRIFLLHSAPEKPDYAANCITNSRCKNRGQGSSLLPSPKHASMANKNEQIWSRGLQGQIQHLLERSGIWILGEG